MRPQERTAPSSSLVKPLTPESEEMLRQMRWVIEQLRELDHPDQIGRPIDQTQARGQLALIEAAVRAEAMGPLLDLLRDARSLSYPFSLSLAKRERIIQRIDAVLLRRTPEAK